MGKEWLIFDGGTGTILQSRGLRGGELPETWNLRRPEDIIDLHCGYLRAGCDIFNTNTFGANALKFPDDLEEIVTAAVNLAQEAKRRCGREDAYVALDIGPTGKLLEPLGDLPFEKAVELFGEVVRYGSRAGADLVLIETMSDSYEAKAAVLAAKENCDLPVLVTVTFDGQGKMLTGGSVDSTVALLEGLRVDALGVNCGLGPEQMIPIVERLTEVCSIPVIVNPKTVVSSFSQCVEIGGKPVIIGERINPTGKKKFKQALRDNDIEYILREGLRQEDSGAHILDVNVGLPEIDEPQMLSEVVQKLQSVLALPLQIDTTDPAALERSMRIYNGKPMVNSVNGKKESIETVFPLVRKYGGVLVALVLDEDGIPSDAEGRIRIARRIYEAADRYGVPREDIVIDGLAMTISSDNTSALVTLETLRRVRDELHGHTILGVSNISFGLPRRAVINSYFLAMALQSGLSAAIMNPGNEEMMEAYRAYCALAGLDPQCMQFIEAYAGTSDRAPAERTVKETAAAAASGPVNGSMGLKESVLRGMAQSAAEAARIALKDTAALDLIDRDLIPALDQVGKGFEAGTVFLPQLLMSAEAAKAAFEVVKEYLKGQPQEVKGRIVLATVKGDIHDIGKNIVKVMLENYGYEVLDLGKDVPPEVIVDTAVREDIKLVGLSALMTTTVVSMEETIRLLREKKPDTRVVVGGAVMTQEYADAIGADCYAKDAMATVHYAEEVFGA